MGFLRLKYFLFFFFFGFFPINARNLSKDLEILHKNTDLSLPLTYNCSMQGGYFTMPSARSLKSGEIVGGFSYLPPYRLYGVGVGLFNYIELTANYWIYHKMIEQNFGHLGFGDDAERALNIKFSLPPLYRWMPHIAMGFNDFIGSKRFYSKYLCVTKQWYDQHLEFTLGWGQGRIKGPFGALAYFPFNNYSSPLQGMSFALEYDGNNYAHHKYEHIKGKNSRFFLNPGIVYTFKKNIQSSCYLLRGEKIAAEVSLNYDWGDTQGLFPKSADPSYFGIGPDENNRAISLRWDPGNSLDKIFKEQGFTLRTMGISQNTFGQKGVVLEIYNEKYRHEHNLHKRLAYIVDKIQWEHYQYVTIVIYSSGVPAFQYTFPQKAVQSFSQGKIGMHELMTVSLQKNVAKYHLSRCLEFQKNSMLFTVHPLFNVYFGSSKGKFKYDLGMTFGMQGDIYNSFYYELYGNGIFSSSTEGIQDRDMLNPSYLIQVRSDTLKYYRRGTVDIERGFIQKCNHWGRGFFSRVSFGYFERAYAGMGAEILYYPVSSLWAMGVEAAVVKKRKYHGLGLQNSVDKYNGQQDQKVSFLGTQYFFNGYIHIPPIDTDIKVSLGSFLAKDKGFRMEAIKKYRSGVQFSLWTTVTNGKDIINGKTYYDKGFSFSFPLDLFLHKSSRSRLSYIASIWLRDVGAKASTGKDLYTILWQDKEE